MAVAAASLFLDDGAPVVASGTMVMNSDAQVQQAMYDYQRGTFGLPWDHRVDDEEWAKVEDFIPTRWAWLRCEAQARADELAQVARANAETMVNALMHHPQYDDLREFKHELEKKYGGDRVVKD